MLCSKRDLLFHPFSEFIAVCVGIDFALHIACAVDGEAAGFVEYVCIHSFDGVGDIDIFQGFATFKGITFDIFYAFGQGNAFERGV